MTREHCIETSNEAAAVAWEHAQNEPDVSLGKIIAAALNGIRCAILATVTKPAPSSAPQCEPPRTWIAYELLGHRSGVAISWEGEIAGRWGLWLDSLREVRGAERHVGEKVPVLELSGEPIFYSNGAIFSIKPLDGAEAAAAEWRIRNGYTRNDDIPF
jgi:hypothetical protein